MATTFEIDKIDGSSLEINGLLRNRVRIGVVKGIDTSSGTDLILEKAYDAMVAAGYTLGSASPDTSSTARLATVRISPLSGDMCRVEMRYEPPNFNQTAYVIRNSSYVTNVPGNMLPGTRTPIRIGYTDVDGKKWPEDNLTIPILRAFRQISISAVIAGDPPTGLQDAIGYANSDTWQGKAKGYWLMVRADTDVSKWTGYSSYTASALTRGFEDWSETGVLRNSMTGKYAKVATADLATLLSPAYSQGIISSVAGAIRVGPFPTTSFTTVFGF